MLTQRLWITLAPWSLLLWKPKINGAVTVLRKQSDLVMKVESQSTIIIIISLSFYLSLFLLIWLPLFLSVLWPTLKSRKIPLGMMRFGSRQRSQECFTLAFHHILLCPTLPSLTCLCAGGGGCPPPLTHDSRANRGSDIMNHIVARSNNTVGGVKQRPKQNQEVGTLSKNKNLYFGNKVKY